MKQIIFPGNYLQPCEAQYEIIFEDGGDSFTRNAHIVVVQSSGGNSGTSLINTDEGRDNILNRILSHDLNGVRVEFVTFSLIYVANGSSHGFRFPIRLDMDDYVKRGNPHDVTDVPSSDLRSALLNLIGKGGKQYSVWTYNIVGGCARFFLEFDEREHLSQSEVARLLAAVKYK